MASEQSYLAKAFDSYYCHHDREIHYRVRGTREILPGRPIVLGDSRVVNSPHVVVTITSTRCNHHNYCDNSDDNIMIKLQWQSWRRSAWHLLSGVGKKGMWRPGGGERQQFSGNSFWNKKYSFKLNMIDFFFFSIFSFPLQENYSYNASRRIYVSREGQNMLDNFTNPSVVVWEVSFS